MEPETYIYTHIFNERSEHNKTEKKIVEKEQGKSEKKKGKKIDKRKRTERKPNSVCTTKTT